MKKVFLLYCTYVQYLVNSLDNFQKLTLSLPVVVSLDILCDKGTLGAGQLKGRHQAGLLQDLPVVGERPGTGRPAGEEEAQPGGDGGEVSEQSSLSSSGSHFGYNEFFYIHVMSTPE